MSQTRVMASAQHWTPTQRGRKRELIARRCPYGCVRVDRPATSSTSYEIGMTLRRNSIRSSSGRTLHRDQVQTSFETNPLPGNPPSSKAIQAVEPEVGTRSVTS